MTLWQVQHIYFHERGEKGDVVPRYAGGDGDGLPSDEERYRRRWRERYALPEKYVDLKWAEFLQQEAYRDHLEKQSPPLATAEIERRIREYIKKQLARRS